MVSGLAASIRSATESATFDLAGSDASSIRTTVKDAFSSPFSLSTMVRITFIVGGGKLSRSKYDDKAMQAVASTLKQLNFVEDRGASCILECAGCFKSQHDTGKNVYTVVVFPRVTGGADEGGDGTNQNEDDEPLIPTNSPGYKLAVCSKTTFQNLLSTYCPTYLEKRECLNCLEGLLQLEQAIDNKLMNGHPLDSAEQSFYDDANDLREKHAHAQKEMSKHVEEGRLSSDEKATLVEMNENKIENLLKQKSSASVMEKLKKAMARKLQLKSIRDDALEEGPALRYESQLTVLRKKVLPLQALEETSRGRLLTLSETRSLTEKGELDEEIERLEYASCGWFEDEDCFQERLKKSRKTFESRYAKSKRGGGGKASNSGVRGGGSGSTPINKWILPGEKPKSAWGSSKGKKVKAKGGAVFSAMMMDSSSDEEEESDEESVDDEVPFTVIQSKKKPHPAAASNMFTSKKAAALMNKSNNSAPTARGGNLAAGGNSIGTQKESTNASKPETGSAPQTAAAKKKKKKKKKSKQSTEQEEIQEVKVADATITESQNKAISTKKDTPSSLSASLLEFWKSLLFPLIMFILNVLTSLVMYLFGGSKKKGGKHKRG
eukprot:CAMPEP_0201644480 /NCGR_PEP_ID=MMETSP0493-20130528/30282_1 /ASSEMBLY_ACC=CAM_ASM_000838 /TAXON_ID=420259 /ORGANISM="Thalassiosira gravida, Strain GMp14c1" /LENGTH=606 /DNA_ID=CAMNT_0048119181 /DNA_START=27 /DNA_END=1847 /DNA_ORIENTATION=-